MSTPMQDWATQGIRDMQALDQPPKDFNGDVLGIGDHVMFAIGRGHLGEGIVVEGVQAPGAVTIQSMICPERFITIDANGAIKVA